MHRGSSKGPRGEAPRPERLPLSASPLLRIEFEVARAGRSEHHSLEVPQCTILRVALRSLGLAAEGCAVLAGDQSVPLDLVLWQDARFKVIPTFSGG